jgi:hemerythrin-like domain-containing protein
MDHQKGRLTVEDFAEAIGGYAKGESAARENLVKSLRVMTALYPNHIWKEDCLLFPMAGGVLTAEDQLAEKFEAVERDLGLKVLERFDRLASELERRVSTDRDAAVRPEGPRR